MNEPTCQCLQWQLQELLLLQATSETEPYLQLLLSPFLCPPHKFSLPFPQYPEHFWENTRHACWSEIRIQGSAGLWPPLGVETWMQSRTLMALLHIHHPPLPWQSHSQCGHCQHTSPLFLRAEGLYIPGISCVLHFSVNTPPNVPPLEQCFPIQSSFFQAILPCLFIQSHSHTCISHFTPLSQEKLLTEKD